MLSISLPSLRSFLPFSKEKDVINLPAVESLDIESTQEKPARALKHLLKLNHANHAILYNNLKFHNHAPHLLSAAFLQGSDAEDLNRLYETESKLLDAWVDSPAEVTPDDWRDHLGCREYQKAFVDFYEDELVRLNYDWKEVVSEYLFSGDEPVFNSIIADLGHPLIHLAYAYELSSREVAMEALGLASVCYGRTHEYLDRPAFSQEEPSYNASSIFTVLTNVRLDNDVEGFFTTPGNDNMEQLFSKHEAVLLNHWNAWKIENPIEQFRESQQLAAGLLLATHKHQTKAHDFFLVHILTTSHAVRVLLPFIPPKFQIPLIRQWWLMTLAIYISQLCPDIPVDEIHQFDLQGRNWDWVAGKAIRSIHSTDAHYVKALRSLKQMETTWGDQDAFYLKAAVKFADEFNGWGGFM
ncbi:hypothetical protein N7456_012675 [Penicillium angulare]|uniref:MGS207 protein n=1 Tax=Penicillium angulare TaxID=116970 RepID=A0A9W9JVM6_9EURO|nr:hypothetical protein N7456_012675 [Penicillium angulare]